MANKKLCRFCSTGFVPQRDEKICPICSMEVSRAVSLPVGEPVIIESQDIKITVPQDADVNLTIKEKTTESEEPEPEKGILPEPVGVPIPEIKPEPVIEVSPELPKEIEVPSTIKEPEPKPVVVKAAAPSSPEEDRKQKDVVNPTE